MFNKIRKGITILGIFIFFLLIFLPSPEGLTIAGKRALAVFVLCLTLWVSQALPLSVTALLGMGLIPLLNIMEMNHTFALFGNKAIFFILGALIMAAGLYQTGLGSRIAFRIIGTFGSSPRKLLVAIAVSAAFLSCIMPEHAVAALLFPIVLEIAVNQDLKPLESNYGKLLFLSMAWGAIIGGITTYLGGARNLLAVGFLEKNYGQTIGFFEWIKYSWPIPFLLLFIYILMIIFVFKIDIENISGARKKLNEKISRAGKMNLREKKLSIVIIIVVLCWLFLSGDIHISVTAVLGGVAIFIFNIVEWKEIEEYVNWSVILMYGGAIVVASSLVETGVTAWLSETVFTRLQVTPFVFLVLIALFTILLTEGVSNVAAVAIVLPLAYSIGDTYSINPVLITLSVALPGGLAFMLPMGTPPNAIAFSSGYYRIQDAVKWGLMLNITGWSIYVFVLKFYWPFLGIKITL